MLGKRGSPGASRLLIKRAGRFMIGGWSLSWGIRLRKFGTGAWRPQMRREKANASCCGLRRRVGRMAICRRAKRRPSSSPPKARRPSCPRAGSSMARRLFSIKPLSRRRRLRRARPIAGRRRCSHLTWIPRCGRPSISRRRRKSTGSNFTRSRSSWPRGRTIPRRAGAAITWWPSVGCCRRSTPSARRAARCGCPSAERRARGLQRRAKRPRNCRQRIKV